MGPPDEFEFERGESGEGMEGFVPPEGFQNFVPPENIAPEQFIEEYQRQYQEQLQRQLLPLNSLQPTAKVGIIIVPELPDSSSSSLSISLAL